MKIENKEYKTTYDFFKNLIYDVAEDFRTNQNKKYNIDETIKNLINDDILWQRMTDAVWHNLVKEQEKR